MTRVDGAPFDYVIVGAGAAGCVLANRLTEDGRTTVVLIEAGPSHHHPLIRMPKGIGKILSDRNYTWAFRSQPAASTAGAVENWVRGRVLGGSTSVNGLMWVRGQPADFDTIAASCGDDWSWRHIGAAYRQIEAHELGAAETRGDRGPMRVTLTPHRGALSEAMIEAGVALGLPRKEDVNAPDNGEGVGYAACNVFKGRRVSAATAFLDPVIASRPNLSILTGALVDRVRFQNRRATGVEVIREGRRDVIPAHQEVLVCGGALSSPGLLQRSGLGPAALLRGLGIDVLQDLPVGESLLEHRAILVQLKLRGVPSMNAIFSGARLVASTAQYFVQHSGPMALAAYEVGAWLKSREDVARPDIQFLLAPYSFDLPSGRKQMESFPGMHLCVYPLRPTSAGSILIRSKDPADGPVLTPNYHANEDDRRTAIDAVRAARRYLAQAPLRDFLEAETYPGSNVNSAEQILDAYRRHGTCAFHAVGSCRMGHDAGSVLDPKLRVRGVEGLRVIDTSVFPQIPSGNTSAPTIALAWRAADVIRSKEE